MSDAIDPVLRELLRSADDLDDAAPAALADYYLDRGDDHAADWARLGGAGMLTPSQDSRLGDLRAHVSAPWRVPPSCDLRWPEVGLLPELTVRLPPALPARQVMAGISVAGLVGEYALGAVRRGELATLCVGDEFDLAEILADDSVRVTAAFRAGGLERAVRRGVPLERLYGLRLRGNGFTPTDVGIVATLDGLGSLDLTALHGPSLRDILLSLPSSLRRLDLPSAPISSEGLLRLRACSRLRELSLSTAGGDVVLGPLPELRRLWLHLTPDGGGATVRGCTSLKMLALRFALAPGAVTLEECAPPEILSLREEEYVYEHPPMALDADLSRLRYLRLHDTFPSILSRRAKTTMRSLEGVHLSGSVNCDVDLHVFEDFDGLRLLKLENCTVVPDTVGGLRSLASLRGLSLRECSYGHHLDLRFLSCLRELDLRGQSTLDRLDVSGAWLGRASPEGLERLTHLLRSRPAVPIAGGSTGSVSLVYLDVRDTPLAEPGLQAAAKAHLPGCVVRG